MSILKFEPKIPQQNLSNLLHKDLLAYCGAGYEFRKEYQPQCIASVLESFQEKQRKQFHLGCGAGKTDIFLLPTLHYLVKGILNNALLTAPRLSLIAQHVNDIERLLSNGKKSGIIDKNFTLTVVEISSKGQKTEDEELASEEVDNIDEENYTKLAENENVIYIRSKNNHRIISKFLNQHGILFVGCIPSVQKTFLPILKKSGKNIDVCINDEYHNLISQSDKKDKKKAFKELFSYCNSVLSFSATPRRGKIMSSVSDDTPDHDNIFGEEVANISTAHLKQYGYLKPHFKVIFVEAGTTHSISSADRANFEALKIDAQQFYQEWNIILKVVLDMITFNEPSKMPHILTATSRVAIINELYNNEVFRTKIFELLPEKTLINVVTGNTSEYLRDEIFTALRQASSDLASLTMQHSVIAEGINVTNFNVAILLRGMNDVIMNQFINRITRNHKDYDTSYIYIQIDRDAEDSYKSNIRRFLTKLLAHGLSLDDIDIETISLSDDGDSSEIPNDDIVNVKANFKHKNIKLALAEVLNDSEYDNWLAAIDTMGVDDLVNELSKL